MHADVHEGRTKQYVEKGKVLQEEAKKEHDDFLAVIEAQQAADEQTKRVEEERRRAIYSNAQGMKEQIGEREEKKRQDKLEWEEEGRKIRQKVADDMQKLETLKG